MSDYSPTTYGTLNSKEDHRDHCRQGDTDKSSFKSSNLYLSLNFVACLVLGPINFVVYKIMYDSYGEGRAFFVSQVI